jgi:Abnormal spindle-like microcephaly-assoc'd, ASPM-SPD-2-Hydin
VVSDATTSPAPITLSGTGIAAGLTLSVNPSSLSFGNVNVSATASKNVTITNTGNSSVAISSVTLTGTQFTLTGGSAVTLSPSQSITLTVQFGPTIAGAAAGTLTIVSNATGSPATVAVSGSGVAAPVQHTVALSWNASSLAAGYNVYRSVTSGGGYSKLNSSLDSGLSYTDSTVQNGQSYFYVTTAVDAAGNESAFSVEVSANIP